MTDDNDGRTGDGQNLTPLAHTRRGVIMAGEAELALTEVERIPEVLYVNLSSCCKQNYLV